MERTFSFLEKLQGLNDEKYAEWEKQEQEEKAKEKHLQLERHYTSAESGVNPRYWHESIETYIPETEEEKNNLQLIKNYIAEDHQYRMLLITGTYGTGKTHLGCSIVRAKGGKYTTSLKLCIEYESGSNFKSEKTKLQILDEYSNLPMLVIDEIGRGLKAEAEKEILAYILNERYEKMLPTVLITNMDSGTFIKYIGTPILDRMKEVAISLSFTGKSRRALKRA